MKNAYKFLIGLAVVLAAHYATYLTGQTHGYKSGYTAAYDKQQLVINVLQGKINATRTATVGKVAEVNTAAASAVTAIERTQATKTVYRTQYVDRFVESPQSANKCLSVEAVDTINKLLELQEP